jgi:hypothetical protein
MIELSEAEKGYVAGIIDGEGYIGCVIATFGQVSMRVEVGSTSIELVNWLYNKFGGKICARKKKRASHHKDAYVWYMCGKKIKYFLEPLLPYLIIKSRHAKTAIKICEMIGEIHDSKWKEISEKDKIKKMILVDQMSKLNKRGVDDAEDSAPVA